MHLRDADARGDLRLREPVEEAQLDDQALALVERATARLDERAVLDLVEAGSSPPSTSCIVSSPCASWPSGCESERVE